MYEAGSGYEGSLRRIDDKSRIKVKLDRGKEQSADNWEVRKWEIRLRDMEHGGALIVCFLSKDFGQVDNQDLRTGPSSNRVLSSHDLIYLAKTKNYSYLRAKGGSHVKYGYANPSSWKKTLGTFLVSTSLVFISKILRGLRFCI